MSARRCQGVTKRGTPCQAAPLKDSDCCLAHSDRETQESTGFGGPQPGAGRPRVPRVTEVMREWVEQHAETILEPYRRAIEGAMVMVTYEGEASVTDIPDLGARINAAEKLQDRVLGKPKQAVEHQGPDGSAPSVQVSLDAATREAIAGALRGRPATRSE